MKEYPAREKPKKLRLPPLTQEELHLIRVRLEATEQTVVSYDREMLLRIVNAGIERKPAPIKNVADWLVGKVFG